MQADTKPDPAPDEARINLDIRCYQSDIKMMLFSIAKLASGLLCGVTPDRYMISLHAIKQLADRAIDYEFKIKTLRNTLKQ